MKIAKAQKQQHDISVNTSYDAVESAIDLAKKTAGNWKLLARRGRIKRWNSSEVGSPQNGEDNLSPPEQP
jgi:hypothetical protein